VCIKEGKKNESTDTAIEDPPESYRSAYLEESNREAKNILDEVGMEDDEMEYSC